MAQLTEIIGTINETLVKIEGIAKKDKEEELKELKGEAEELNKKHGQLRDKAHKYGANIRKYNHVRDSLDSFASEIDQVREVLKTKVGEAINEAFERFKDVFQQRWNKFNTADLEKEDAATLKAVISDVSDNIQLVTAFIAAGDFAKAETLFLDIDSSFNKIYAIVDGFYDNLIQDLQTSGS